MYGNELYHHGVKGMKWGVRKDVMRESSNIATSSKNVVGSVSKMKSAKRTARASKSANTMTDKELRDRINRMALEQQYSQLSSADKSAGSAYVSNTLEIAGNVLAAGASAAAIAVSLKALKD